MVLDLLTLFLGKIKIGPRLEPVKPGSTVGIGIGLVNSIDPYIAKITTTVITAKQLIRIVKNTAAVFSTNFFESYCGFMDNVI